MQKYSITAILMKFYPSFTSASKQLICANSISQQGKSIFPSPSVTPIPFTLSYITNGIESQAQISTTDVNGIAGKGTLLFSLKIPLPGSHLAPPQK